MTQYNKKAKFTVKKNKDKNYVHIDRPLSEKGEEKMVKIVNSVEKMNTYRFLPFITYKIFRKKYKTTGGKLKVSVKERLISLGGHHDSFVFKHYADPLSQKYDDYSLKYGFTDCSVAYRKNQNKSNITTAKEVFDFMEDNGEVWVLKGDFKGFFDNLNHSYLKKMVLKTMNEQSFSKDWYKVIKAITAYHTIDRKKLMSERNKKTYRSNGNRAFFNNRKEFSGLVKNKRIKITKKNILGIPQGTAISAILANVYMIEFDEKIYLKTMEFHGIYRRYSDDFIVCIPKKYMEKKYFLEFKKSIIKKSNELLKLKIEESKTKSFKYIREEQSIYLIGSEDKKSALSYLGFTFDGVTVSIRPKSIYKFIYKSKKKISLLKQESRSTQNNRGFRKKIVRGYVDGSKVIGPRISMLSYGDSAQKIMEKDAKYKVVIKQQIMRQLNKNQILISK